MMFKFPYGGYIFSVAIFFCQFLEELKVVWMNMTREEVSSG